jgi:hypothetical protein
MGVEDVLKSGFGGVGREYDTEGYVKWSGDGLESDKSEVLSLRLHYQ